MAAFLNNDPRFMYRYCSQNEINLLGLSEQDFVQVYSRLIAPRLAPFVKKGKIVTERNGDGAQGVAYAEIRTNDEKRLPIVIVLDWSEDGPETELVKLLFYAWQADAARAGKRLDSEGLRAARLSGLRADLSELKTIGIAGYIVDEQTEPRIRTWEEFESLGK
jgi:hypothetical protein